MCIIFTGLSNRCVFFRQSDSPVKLLFHPTGLLESPRMPLAESVLLTEIMDEIRKQVGVVFGQDSQ